MVTLDTALVFVDGVAMVTEHRVRSSRHHLLPLAFGDGLVRRNELGWIGVNDHAHPRRLPAHFDRLVGPFMINGTPANRRAVDAPLTPGLRARVGQKVVEHPPANACGRAGHDIAWLAHLLPIVVRPRVAELAQRLGLDPVERAELGEELL